jgi:molybdate transport system regulatory protein
MPKTMPSAKENEPISECTAQSIQHLNPAQLKSLTEPFSEWHETAPSNYIREVRGRYWLAFLLLRFTGAKIGEVLSVNDQSQINFEQNEIKILPSRRLRSRKLARIVPVPPEVLLRVSVYRTEFPRMAGRVFAIDPGNFRREFYRRSEEARIPKKLSYPNILRHTRALELLEAGVPLTTVQQLLGHISSGTTAAYLQCSEIAAVEILIEKGLL